MKCSAVIWCLFLVKCCKSGNIRCREKWLDLGIPSSRYLHLSKIVDFDSALNVCKEEKSNVAEIESREEYDAVKEYLSE